MGPALAVAVRACTVTPSRAVGGATNTMISKHPRPSTRAAAALALATSATALALPAAAQDAGTAPARVHMIDETELQVRLWTPSPEGGYVFRINATVYGVNSDQDAVHVQFKQGNRTLAQVRCPLNRFDSDNHASALECQTSPEALLTATGNVSVDLVYEDDQTNQREVIRTLNLRVNRYPYWVGNRNNRPVVGGRYQISGDDMLGTAFVYRRHPNLRQTEAHEEQGLTFYTAYSGTWRSGNVTTLRCSVNGTRLPSDVRGSMDSFADFDVDEWPGQSAPQRHLTWYRARFSTQNLWWGRRVPFPSSHAGYNTENTMFLAEHPGNWSCDLRVDGTTQRTFNFVVTPDGMVAPHPEQQTASALRLLNGVSLVDVRLPNPDPVDAVVNPAAIRAGAQYGHRWENAASVRDMLAALPPAVGSSEPGHGGATTTAAAGGGRRGRH